MTAIWLMNRIAVNWKTHFDKTSMKKRDYVTTIRMNEKKTAWNASFFHSICCITTVD